MVLLATAVLGEGSAVAAEQQDVLNLDAPPAVTDVAANCDVQEAADVQAAGVLADACGTSVTVTDSLTPWSTGFVDGESGAVIVSSSMSAVRQDSDCDGTWAPVDVEVGASPVDDAADQESSGMLPVTGGVEPIWLNPGGEAGDGLPLAMIGPEGSRVRMFSQSLSLVEAAAAVVLEERVEYDFGRGVTLVVSVNHDGTHVTPVVRLADPQALADLTDVLLADSPAAGAASTAAASSTGAAESAAAETAGSDSGELVLAFPLEVSDGLSVVQREVGFEIVDATGDVRFESGAAVQWDSAGADQPQGVDQLQAETRTAAMDAGTVASDADDGTTAAGDGPVNRESEPLPGDTVTQMDVRVTAEGSRDVVEVVPDAGMLTDPATSWPVRLDPRIGADRPFRYGMVQNYSGWKNTPHVNFEASEGMGYCDPNLDARCAGVVNVQRLYFQFQNLNNGSGNWLGQLDASDVIGAGFRPVGDHQVDCSNRQVNAHMTDMIDAGLVWDSQPAVWSLQDYRSVTHRSGCTDQVGRIRFDVVSAARAAATAGNSWLTFRVSASNESSMLWWKRYQGSTATLEIAYDRAPNPPAASTMKLRHDPGGATAVVACETEWADRPLIRSNKPTLSARASDPDGTNVEIAFRVLGDGGQTLWTSGWKGPAGPSTDATAMPTGLARSGEYRWQAAVRSGGRYTGWDESPACRFGVDAVDPAAPEITIGNFPEGQVSGAFGDLAWIKISPNGSNDVVRYYWDFNTSEPDNQSDVEPGQSKSFSVLVPRTGYNYLAAQAQDASGRRSAVTIYEFFVGNPHTTSWWQFNDTAWATTRPTAAGNSTPGAATVTGPLTPSSGVTWAWGWQGTGGVSPRGASDGVPDGGLVFNSSTDIARTVHPAMATDKSFSFSAFMRAGDRDPDGAVVDLGGSAAGVSQEGRQVTGPHLGFSKSPLCPVDDEDIAPEERRCWAFWMTTGEGTTNNVIARTPLPVVAGQWVNVVGVHDAYTGTLHAYACVAGNPRVVRSGKRETGTSGWVDTAYDASWNAGSALRLGSGMNVLGDPTWGFHGAVDEVRVYADQKLGLGENADIPTEISKMCQGGALEGLTP
ncbi:hypothetical protein [Promicromonospora sp. NPDC050249]|uniref:hypothetical protein n=1 Tax=Promicromonospora sp. NPDC050249 TaxID=3154743 RepID=UPI00340AAF14